MIMKSVPVQRQILDRAKQAVESVALWNALSVNVPKAPKKFHPPMILTKMMGKTTAKARKQIIQSLSIQNNEEKKDTKPPQEDDGIGRESPCASEEKTIDESEAQMNESANGSLLVSGTDISITPLKENAIANETLEVSLNESSFLSGTEIASTPCKDANTSFDSIGSQDTPTSSIAPKTPASKKKGPKVNLAKRAEKEAQKQKLKEEKELQRSEKKRKLEEEKAEKEKVKKEKKEAKEKEKQLQQEKLQKEKEEKEKLKEIEKQKKEEERLQREEEKKKKQAAIEAKLEEKRQKEEEKRQKEEDKRKEEEEKKKKAEMAKQAFQSFFIKPKENVEKPVITKPNQGQFVPFQLKKDMHLAPATRRDALSGDAKLSFDEALENSTMSMKTYLNELKNSQAKPHRTGRILRTNPEPAEDVEVVHDPEALKKVIHKVKLLQFHTDHRPPYYGTWRKAPVLFPRNPWKKDEDMFDYEVDSDDEWEEEEPGESLSCSDGEDDKGEKGDEDENDEEEDGWMVPHGYLSEDEGCNEDDEITPEKLKLQQLAKAKAWEEEQKRKLQAAPLIAVGCFFEHSPSSLMAGDVRLLYEFRGVVISPSVPIPTSLFGTPEQDPEEPTTPDKAGTTPSQRGAVKKAVPDEAMPDLIRLVHGNVRGIKHLIRDFRVFWFKKESAENPAEPTTPKGKLDKSMHETDGEVSFMDESIQENTAEGGGKQGEEALADQETDEGKKCSISKRQLDIKINAIAVREKRQTLKTCWYVHDAILKEFGLEGLICNSLVQREPTVAVETVKEAAPTPAPVKDQRSIMDFALSKEECAKKEALLPKPVDSPQVKPLPKTVESPQIKPQQSDQKSIIDFAMSKEELAKREPKTPKGETASRTAPQSAVKDSKKGGQMSIMAFAKSEQVKSSCIKDTVKSDPVPMETDEADVIIIESTSDVQLASSTACHEKSASIVTTVDSSSTSSSSNIPSCQATSDIVSEPKISASRDKPVNSEAPQPSGEEDPSKPNSFARKELHKLQNCFVKLEKFKYEN
ncbi:hypothetical protein EGW08_004287 [Elysia chlorotica]|uniref:Chromatin assembly factor 1 subunit p150 C-terminal domain-containing protein n=1 Tax=Elysia chlorotica TaxID=188477 RepID=A0A433U282_ELYCH|nr:hypothetical protein EGW08_004287 [Elysia chlorotica]